MTNANVSVVLHKIGDLRIEETEIPDPKASEVMIRMKAVGICGSDIHFWQEGKIGDSLVVTKPLVLGHECSGTITKVGKNVNNFKEGDRVAVEPHGGICRTCEACITGQYNLCKDVTCMATPPTDGGLSRYYNHDAEFVYRLPENITFEEGSLAEPLSVGIHACRRARVGLNHKVLVCGAGPIGLVTMIAAKACGASSVCITDVDEARLQFARAHWSCHTVHVKSADTPLSCTTQVTQLLQGHPDRTIDCSGVQFALNLGVYATKPGGVFALVGMGQSILEIPVVESLVKEIDIVGSFRYTNTWPTALDLISRGKVDVLPLITHRYKFEDSIEAFNMAKSGKGVKVMIDCN